METKKFVNVDILIIDISIPYEDMNDIGCKYCECMEFEELIEQKEF